MSQAKKGIKKQPSKTSNREGAIWLAGIIIVIGLLTYFGLMGIMLEPLWNEIKEWIPLL